MKETQSNDTEQSEDVQRVEPPAARICKRCEYTEKVTQLPKVVAQWQCPECGCGKHRINSWEPDQKGDSGGRWEVRLNDERLAEPPAEETSKGRFDSRTEARRKAIRVSQAQDLNYGVWDRDNECFAGRKERDKE